MKQKDNVMCFSQCLFHHTKYTQLICIFGMNVRGHQNITFCTHRTITQSTLCRGTKQGGIQPNVIHWVSLGNSTSPSTLNHIQSLLAHRRVYCARGDINTLTHTGKYIEHYNTGAAIVFRPRSVVFSIYFWEKEMRWVQFISFLQ